MDLEGRDVGLGLDRGDLVDVQLRLAVRGVGVGVAGVGRVVMVVVPVPVAVYVMVPTSTRGYICKHKMIYIEAHHDIYYVLRYYALLYLICILVGTLRTTVPNLHTCRYPTNSST